MNEQELKKKAEQQLREHPVIIERMPGVLQTVSAPAVSIMENLAKRDLDWSFFYFIFKDDFMTIVYPEDRQIELGSRLLKKEVEKPGHFQSFITEWEPIDESFTMLCKRLDKLDLDSLSMDDVRKSYREFTELFFDVWALPLISTAVAYYSDNFWIPKIIKKYGEGGLNDFTLLSTSKEMSIAKEEEHELLEIAFEFTQGKDADEKLREHADKYYWMNINYRDVDKLNVDYFEQRIKEMEHPDKVLFEFNNKRKEFLRKHDQLLKDNGFTEEENIIAMLIREATIFQDRRKRNNLIGNYFLGKFADAISMKTDYSKKQLSYVSVFEMDTILSGKGPDKEELNRRAEYTVFYIDPKERHILGRCKELYNFLNSYDKPKKDIEELKGIPASLGRAKGTARVVLDASKANDFEEGDILVSSMTRPEFTGLMKKAGAIVTDEGGITCHAAIVSRELGKPCIIGTKNATQVLKDGDLVEVDADNGVVRKLS